jgi:septal ring factor EnvC (AmiA/AmiB activator)
MMSEAFCRYIKEFRQPCNKVRRELIEAFNKKLHYSQIQSDNFKRPNNERIYAKITKNLKKFKNAPKPLQLSNFAEINEKQRKLIEYKRMLEAINEKTNYMFEQMKEINKITDKKCFEIEKEMSITENIF